MKSHGCQNKKGDVDTFHMNWSHVEINHYISIFIFLEVHTIIEWIIKQHTKTHGINKYSTLFKLMSFKYCGE